MDMLVSLIGFLAPILGVAAFLLSRSALNDIPE